MRFDQQQRKCDTVICIYELNAQYIFMLFVVFFDFERYNSMCHRNLEYFLY